jgi:hypothetical protein
VSDEKEEPGIEIFLRACQFVNPRHEQGTGDPSVAPKQDPQL